MRYKKTSSNETDVGQSESNVKVALEIVRHVPCCAMKPHQEIRTDYLRDAQYIHQRVKE